MTGGVRMKVGGELSNSLQPVWLALGTGILLFLSFPGSVGFWPLAWIALVPLLFALKDTGGSSLFLADTAICPCGSQYRLLFSLPFT
jgi:hypothetical protein